MTAWLAGITLAALVVILAVFRAVVTLSRRTGRAQGELSESARRLAEAERGEDFAAGIGREARHVFGIRGPEGR